MLYEGKKKRKVNRKDGKEKNKKMKEANQRYEIRKKRAKILTSII